MEDLGDHAPDVMSVHCPSRSVLNHVTSRWGTLVLLALQDRTLRFSDLRRHIGGVSERMLAQTLKTLEQDGFILRHAHNVVPPHVDYSLTPLGQEVTQRLRGLTDWLEGNINRVLAARNAADSR